jgi:hypothetical protein
VIEDGRVVVVRGVVSGVVDGSRVDIATKVSVSTLQSAAVCWH